MSSEQGFSFKTFDNELEIPEYMGNGVFNVLSPIDAVVPKGTEKWLRLRFSVRCPPGNLLQFIPHPSLLQRFTLEVSNTIVDPNDKKQQIKVCVFNKGPKDFNLNKNRFFCRMIFVKCVTFGPPPPPKIEESKAKAPAPKNKAKSGIKVFYPQEHEVLYQDPVSGSEDCE